MRLLLLTPQLPYPPRQGTTLRNYNLIRILSQSHTVDLLTFLAPGETLTADNPLHNHCREVGCVPQPEHRMGERLLALLASPLPDMALRLERPAMHEALRSFLDQNEYDIVQVEGIEMAQYGMAVASSTARAGRARVVFDDHNCEYLLQKRNALTDLRQPKRWLAALYSIVQWQKLRAYERDVCRLADATVAVSEPDAAALLGLYPSVDVTVVPNGIDPSTYSAGLLAGEAQQLSGPDREQLLVFTGKMDYRPNIDAVLWFADQVLPLIQEQRPEVRFQIVGMQPHRRLDRLRDRPGIEITGAVDDIVPYIEKATVYVIPMRVGGGTRFKVLEAMASGKAIVSTGMGVEGIAIEDEQHLLIADTAHEYATAVLRCLGDPQLRINLGREAREFVALAYDWDKIVPELEHLYVRLSNAMNPPNGNAHQG